MTATVARRRPAAATSPTFARCRQAITEALAAAGRPLRRKTLVKQLREGTTRHSVSVITKALAEMTRTGELVNPRDGEGYQLPAAGTAGELRRVACLAKQLADAVPPAMWALPVDRIHLFGALEQLAGTSAAVANLIR